LIQQSDLENQVRVLHTAYYTPAQISGALESIYGVDTQLISDGNYFVVENQPPPSQVLDSKPMIIACGGWSHRSTLYGGDQYSRRDDNLLDPAKDAAKIRAFFVHPDWTRRGVGGIVLTACEQAALKAGFKRAEMGATLSGVPFYLSKGYGKVGERSMVPVGSGDGVLLEVVRMEKDLCPEDDIV